MSLLPQKLQPQTTMNNLTWTASALLGSYVLYQQYLVSYPVHHKNDEENSELLSDDYDKRKKSALDHGLVPVNEEARSYVNYTKTSHVNSMINRAILNNPLADVPEGDERMDEFKRLSIQSAFGRA